MSFKVVTQRPSNSIAREVPPDEQLPKPQTVQVKNTAPQGLVDGFDDTQGTSARTDVA